jgi:hypothetical protein
MSDRVFDQTVLNEFLAKRAGERKSIMRHLTRLERKALKELVRAETRRSQDRRGGSKPSSKAYSPWLSNRLDDIVKNRDRADPPVTQNVFTIVARTLGHEPAIYERDLTRTVTDMPETTLSAGDRRESMK